MYKCYDLKKPKLNKKKCLKNYNFRFFIDNVYIFFLKDQFVLSFVLFEKKFNKITRKLKKKNLKKIKKTQNSGFYNVKPHVGCMVSLTKAIFKYSLNRDGLYVPWCPLLPSSPPDCPKIPAENRIMIISIKEILKGGIAYIDHQIHFPLFPFVHLFHELLAPELPVVWLFLFQ